MLAVFNGISRSAYFDRRSRRSRFQVGESTAVAGGLKDTSLRVTLQPSLEYSATELSRLVVRPHCSNRSIHDNSWIVGRYAIGV